MRLMATQPLTYGTRRMQAGDLFKAPDDYAALLLAKGEATVAPAGAKQVAEPAKVAAPVGPTTMPEQRPRGRRRNQGPATES